MYLVNNAYNSCWLLTDSPIWLRSVCKSVLAGIPGAPGPGAPGAGAAAGSDAGVLGGFSCCPLSLGFSGSALLLVFQNIPRGRPTAAASLRTATVCGI